MELLILMILLSMCRTQSSGFNSKSKVVFFFNENPDFQLVVDGEPASFEASGFVEFQAQQEWAKVQYFKNGCLCFETELALDAPKILFQAPFFYHKPALVN